MADLQVGPPILLHSAAHWDHQPRRTRLVLGHLARRGEVLVVEPPQHLDDLRRPRLEHRDAGSRILRVLPRLPAICRGRDGATMLAVRALLLELLGLGGPFAHRFDAPVHWFCTPGPAPAMLGAFGECAVVYDRSAVTGPSRGVASAMGARERWLSAHADLVLDGREAPREIVPLVVAMAAGRRRHDGTWTDDRRAPGQRARGPSVFRSSRRASSFCSD